MFQAAQNGLQQVLTMRSMQVSYLEQSFSLAVPKVYEECLARIAEKAGIEGRVAWGIEYHDGEQFLQVDNEVDYQNMLDGWEEQQGSLRVNVKIDSNSRSVSEIKLKEDHELDLDMEISHEGPDSSIKNDEEEQAEEKEEGEEEEEEQEQESEGGIEEKKQQPKNSEIAQSSEGHIEIVENESNLNESASQKDQQSDKLSVSDKQDLREDLQSNEKEENNEQQEKENNQEQEDNQEQQDKQKEENKQEEQNNQGEENQEEKNQGEENQEEEIDEQKQGSQEGKQSNQDILSNGEGSKGGQTEVNEPTSANLQRYQQGIEIVALKQDEPVISQQRAEVQEVHIPSAAEQKTPTQQSQLSEHSEQSHPEQNKHHDVSHEKAQKIESALDEAPTQQRVPRDVQFEFKADAAQPGCSFCRKTSPHLQFLCGFYDIHSCEECEEKWAIVSRKKRIGSRTSRPAAPYRRGLKPCSLCGEADGLSRLNAFDINICTACSWKWEFAPLSSHVWDS